MPKLENYSAPASVAPLQGGRAATPGDMSASYETVGPALQKTSSTIMAHLEASEERQVLVKQAQIRAKYAQQLDDAVISGANTDAIRQNMQDDLDKSAEGLQTRVGQATADWHAARTNELFNHEANTIAVHRASEKAKVEGQDFLITTGDLVTRNPGYLPQAERDNEMFWSTYKGSLSPEQIAIYKQDYKRHFNMEAAMSRARLDPVGAKAAMATSEYYITPEQKGVVIGHADQYIRAKREDDRYAHQLKKEAQHEKDQAMFDNMLKDFSAGKKANWSQTVILGLKGIDPGMKTQMLSTFEHLIKPPKIDPEAANTAYQNIFRPEGDPLRIESESTIDALVVKGSVDAREHSELRAAFANRDKPETQLENVFLARVDMLINPKDTLGLILNPDGPMNSYSFRKELSAVRATWPKDKSVAPLYDPKSKEYEQNIQPLLRKYRATSVFVPNSAGVIEQRPIPQPTDTLPLIKNQAELDKFPGGRYRTPTDPPGKFREKPKGPQTATGTIKTEQQHPSGVNVDDYFIEQTK